ncbi:unnamed protein product [Rotaria sp. Silwood2]|nr:unnamed protein product [Rotaria sp. Silwood2]CAF2501817.1 unnamed protein product [Rotaria sp. Silwood2]CAF2732441.1 unnamed protein product [Rotaria sp. Silwood2]CAF2899509.1 unnamed protein product [Rotaria sp. Silwood2]CAF3865800.1 unnamed protein product [Rotaria sp. Silwood2]
MDDDFLAEHVLPLMNLHNQDVDISNEQLLNVTNSNIDHSLSSVLETGSEITLNATNEHVELTSKFFNNPQFSDIRLRVGTNIYYVHKFILAKSSDVLATLLYSQHWTSNESEILLEEQDECQGDVFEKFLKFFYTAKVTLHESIVIGLLCLADKYNVQSLRNLCTQYMIMKAKPPNVRNGIAWYSIAKQFSLDDLRDACIKTVAWNMEYLLSNINQSEWFRCEFDFIRDLLSTSNLVITNEYRLYTSLSDWLLARSSDTLILLYACELLPLIRFSQMLPIQLYQIEESFLYKKNNNNQQIQDLLKRLLCQAYRFHTLASLRRDIDNPEFSPLERYLPREYTEMNITDRVDIQSTLRFGIQVDVQTCSSPVPSIDRTADWKVVYRKRSHDKWTLKVHRHDAPNETHAQVTAIIYDCERRVLQVEQGETFIFTVSNQYDLEIVLNNPYEAKELYLLIKPVIS